MYEFIKSPTSVNGKKITNRFVAQAMEINSASQGGAVSDEILNRYKQLAEGKWGLAFSEAISVTDEYMARKNGLIINRENLKGLKKLVNDFKKINPEGLFLFQLTHSGRCSGDFSKKIKAYDDENQDVPIASLGEMENTKDQFMEAVEFAHEAGVDGVDIKACHGYLGGEILRPRNQRPDKFGGNLKNRTRLLSSIIEYAAKEFPHMIIGTRLSLYEGMRGGCGTSGADEIIEDLDDMMDIITIAIDSGAHYINVSAGIPMVTPDITRPEKASRANMLHHFRYAKVVKELFNNVVVIGSSYSSACEESLDFAEENIRKGYVDLVGYGRQNLADPFFPRKVLEENVEYDVCKICGGCSRLLKKQEKVHCVVYE